MKRLALVALLVSVCSLPATAGDMRYVSELMEITLRTGPGTGRKIIAMLPSDLKVEVLTPGDEWTQIRTPDGKEGWVVSRYLTAEMPKSLQLERLQRKYEALVKKADELAKQNNELKTRNQELGSELATKAKSLDELAASYKTLKDDSAEFLKVKARYQKAATRLTELSAKSEKLEEALSKLELHQNIRWFLSGAGVLLVGFIIGFSAKRQRRRSSLL